MKSKNQTQSRRKYDEDFKSEVVKMVENGQSTQSVAQSLGIGENLIYRWRNKKKTTVKLAIQGEGSDLSVKLLEENENLKQKIKHIEQERDILKKALSIFSRVS